MFRFAQKERGAHRFKNPAAPSRKKDISLYLKRAISSERVGKVTLAAEDYEKVLSAALSSDNRLDDRRRCDLALKIGCSPTWLPALAPALSQGVHACEPKRALERLEQWLSKPSAIKHDET